MAVRRDARFLNWRYAGSFNPGYRILEATRDGILMGYAVLRIRNPGAFRSGWIVDMLADPDGTDCLLDAAVKYFRRENAGRVNCLISNGQYEKALSRNGFLRRKSREQLMVHGVLIRENIELVRRRANWHITAGDSDFDR